MDYSYFELKVSGDFESSNNNYVVSLFENDKMVATNSFELQLRNNIKLIQMLRELEEKVTVCIPQPKETVHIELGKMLYSKIFSGKVGELFKDQMLNAQRNRHGIRLSLRFTESIPEIAALPWEYMHNGEDFLATRRDILFSRLPAEVIKLESTPLNSILRMLVIISGPEDPQVSSLNTEKEQEIILEAVDKLYRDRKIKVDFTEDATFENIQGYLNENEYHIVHFTGHGAWKDGKGYLLFETEDRKPRYMDNKQIADLFSDLGLRLVVLSSCESAKGSNKQAFSDLASMLSKRGIPAVLAMQYSILDKVATKFASTFYGTLANGKLVDSALKEARISMKNSEKSNSLDFATPVLYLSDPNCLKIGDIRPEPQEFIYKPMMLPDLQVMKKGFIARKKELRILEKGFLSDLKRVAIIHGLGGIGKTVLATRLVLRMEDHFDGIFGIRCNSTTRPEDILNKLNTYLMMKGRNELNQIICQQVPLEVKTSVLVNIISQIPFLIIFDNFEDCLNEEKNDIQNPELNSFIQQLFNGTISNTKFIITTRYDFDPLDGRLTESVEHLSLPELQFPQTNWLMDNYRELADLDFNKKKEIYKLIGGHPWMIGQFAKNAAVEGVDSLLLDLEPLRKNLIEFTLLDRSYARLDERSQRLLLCASVYNEAIPEEALSWIIGDDKEPSPSILETLQQLIQCGMISKEEVYSETVYSEHTIVKDFASKKLTETDQRQLLIRAAHHYENLVSENKNIWDYLTARNYYFQAKDWENANRIVEVTSDFLIRWGYIQLTMDLLQESIDTTLGNVKINAEFMLATIFQRLGDLKTAFTRFNSIKSKYENVGDKSGIADTLHQLGMIQQQQGNYEEAVKLYNQCIEIFEELGDKSGIAITLLHLGMIQQNQSNYKEAVTKYNQCIKTFEELGDKSGIAKALHHLGMIQQQQGNYEKAVNKYNQSLEIKKELGDKSGIARTLLHLGMIQKDQGNYEEAVKLYNQSLEIEKELGDKSGIAKTLLQLGNVHYIQGNYEEAVNKYNQSLEIEKELEDKGGIASTLHQLGMIQQDQGNYEEAVKLYNQCIKTFEELEDKSGISSSLLQLGNVHYIQGDYEEAVNKYNQSLEIEKELGGQSRIASSTLLQLGNVHYIQGNYEEAVNKYNQSLEIAKKLRDKSGIASTLHHLGMIQQDQGNYEEAVNKYNQSLGISKELGGKRGIASTLGQLGRIYEKREDYAKALLNYLLALQIFEELNSPHKQLAQQDIDRLRDMMGEEEFNATIDKLRKQNDS